MRDDLNARAQRRMAVLDPVRLVIDNYPEGGERDCLRAEPSAAARARPARAAASRASCGSSATTSRRTPPKGYFRLAPGAEVRLRYAYIVRCIGVEKDADGNVTVVHCTYDPDTRSGTPGADARKVKGNIHWLVGGARGAGRSAALRPAVPRAVSRARACRGGAARTPPRRSRRRRTRPSSPATTTTTTTSRRAQLPRRPQSGRKRVITRLRRARARARRRRRRASSSSGTATSSPICADHAPGKPVFNRTVTLRDSWAAAVGARRAAARRGGASPRRIAWNVRGDATTPRARSRRASPPTEIAMKRIVLFLADQSRGPGRAVGRAASCSASTGRCTRRPASTTAPLLAFSAVVGFTGSIISLLMSKSMAKWSTGAHVIEQPSNEAEAWLVETVRRLAHDGRHRHARSRDLRRRRRTRSPPARSRTRRSSPSRPGLLQSMNKEEVEAVLGHEIAHVANGDMVTLTLIQGVVNTFVVFFARVVGTIVDKAVFRSERGNGPGYFITVMVCQIVFGILASMIVAWFSRQREFRADAGSAQVPRLAAADGERAAAPRRASSRARCRRRCRRSASPTRTRVMALFSTHPPIEAAHRRARDPARRLTAARERARRAARARWHNGTLGPAPGLSALPSRSIP